ncbi:MAG: hypothetical protein COA86_08755 [Kangiella sp.]|nr:MAG: hypothetical protein COA86_08755 [Kangiella sp.]
MPILNKSILFVALCFFSTISFASDSNHQKSHYIGIFAGVLDADESETLLGIEYEFKINSHWGVGFVYEKASDAHHGDGITSKIIAGYYHPMAGWRLGAGFGRETVGGAHGHIESLTHYGVSYEFHVGGIGIEPSFNVDTIDGETVNVYGVALVWAF